MDVKLCVLQILVLLLGCCHGKGEQHFINNYYHRAMAMYMQERQRNVYIGVAVTI